MEGGLAYTKAQTVVCRILVAGNATAISFTASCIKRMSVSSGSVLQWRRMQSLGLSEDYKANEH